MPKLPTDHLVHNAPSKGFLGGTQLIYRVGDYGLSVIDSPRAHSYPYAWEVAVVRFPTDKWEDGFTLLYDTPLTSDVEVFMTDKDASDFINRAFDYFHEVQPKEV